MRQPAAGCAGAAASVARPSYEARNTGAPEQGEGEGMPIRLVSLNRNLEVLQIKWSDTVATVLSPRTETKEAGVIQIIELRFS